MMRLPPRTGPADSRVGEDRRKAASCTKAAACSLAFLLCSLQCWRQKRAGLSGRGWRGENLAELSLGFQQIFWFLPNRSA